MDHSNQQLLKGTFPVVPATFNDQGGIDLLSFERVANYIINCGADGLVFPGLASEYDQLSRAERLSMSKTLGKLAQGKIPFVVGCSAAKPEQVIEYAVEGAKAGATCAMVMPHRQYENDDKKLVEFYQTLARETLIPIMLQNAPAPMGIGLPIDKVVTILEQVPEIHYVKEEAMPSGHRIEQLLKTAPDTLKGVFGGGGGRYIIDELNRGALGTVPAAELTEIHIALLDAHQKNDLQGAQKLFTNMLPILNMQGVYRWSLTKEVLLRRGIISSTHIRATGARMDEEDKKQLEAFWHNVKDIMGELTEQAALTTQQTATL